jgi:hypothetical protein
VFSNPVVMPAAPAAPALYTADGSGVGQAQVLNEDGTPNSDGNPVLAGSIVTISVNAFGDIGSLAVFINSYALGVDGRVVDDIFQVRVRVPEQPNGIRLSPVRVEIDGASSQTGVFVAVK